jgi:hypothetical protein
MVSSIRKVGVVDNSDFLVGDVVVNHQPDPAWREAVIANAGGQCENIDNGYRCGSTNKQYMKAVSFRPGSKDPKDGVALCPSHADNIEGKPKTNVSLTFNVTRDQSNARG